MSAAFTRTPTGIVGKWNFYPVPTLWVEGPTDIYFYEPIVRDIPCRIEAFHGVDNLKALLEGLTRSSLPYVVVIDGDYKILKPRKSGHKHVIALNRYSCENYLWEPEPLNRSCHRHARSGDRNDVVSAELLRLEEHIEVSLRELVELDIAARRSDPSPDVLPKRMESLLVKHDEPQIDPSRVASLKSAAETALSATVIEEARIDTAEYLATRPLVHLLNGHLLFGMLRLLFTRVTTTLRGSKAVISDDALLQLLADMTWHRPTSKEHQQLKRIVRRTIKALQSQFPPLSRA